MEESIIYMSNKGLKILLRLVQEALSGMVKRTIKGVNIFSINSITDIKNLKNEL